MRALPSMKRVVATAFSLLLLVLAPAENHPPHESLPRGALQYDEQRLTNGLRIMSQESTTGINGD